MKNKLEVTEIILNPTIIYTDNVREEFEVIRMIDKGVIIGRIPDGDFLLVRIGIIGNEHWNKTFGGSDQDYCYSVQQTNEGGYIMTGYTKSFGAGDRDVCLVKTDENGNMLWNKTFGGADDDWGYSVQQTSDTGYIITGSTNSYGSKDVWLIRTDNHGKELWNKTFGGGTLEYGRSVQQTSDGGYIFTGYANGVWLIKTDGSGNKIWDNKFEGTRSETLHGESVQQTSDGGYIIAGYKKFSGGQDGILIKTDSQGKIKSKSLNYIIFSKDSMNNYILQYFSRLIYSFPFLSGILNL